MSATISIPLMAKRNADTGKKEPIAARVDPELLAWLESRALEEDRSLSYMVEKAIRLMREQTDAKRADKPKR